MTGVKTQCIHGHELTEENSYTDPRGRTVCRTCVRARMQEHRKRDKAINPDKWAKRRKREREQAVARISVRRAVQTALETGRLIRPAACERCGTVGAVQAHHEDYAKPLEVVWLCRSCHGLTHRKGAQPSVEAFEWREQYEERALTLDEKGEHGAADDIRTLVDGIVQLERDLASLAAVVAELRGESR